MAEDEVDEDTLMDDGSLDWAAVVGTLFGGWALAIASGTASVIETITTKVSDALRGVAQFEASLFDVAISTMTGGVDSAWSQLVTEAEALGPLSIWVVGLQIGLAMFLISEGRERYGP